MSSEVAVASTFLPEYCGLLHELTNGAPCLILELTPNRTMTPSTSLTSITCADGINYDVISAKTFTVGPREIRSMTREVQRVTYTCKRPRGRRFYFVIGYETGRFSRAV